MSNTVTAGQIKKCPSCGMELGAFETKCPSCGIEISNATVANSLQTFFTKLENISDFDTKLSVIGSYPIPNAKEDLFEFMVTAYSQITLADDDWQIEKLNAAWGAKCKQAYAKAEIVLSGDKLMDKIEVMMGKITALEQEGRKEKTISKKKTSRDNFISKYRKVFIIAVAVIVLTPIIVCLAIMEKSEKRSAENKRLEAIAAEVTEAVNNGDLSTARLKANELWGDSDLLDKDDEDRLERRRTQLLQEIERLEGRQSE